MSKEKRNSLCRVDFLVNGGAEELLDRLFPHEALQASFERDFRTHDLRRVSVNTEQF